MRSRHFPGGGWWDHGHDWGHRYGPGSHAWGVFGRYIMRRIAVAMVVALSVPFVVGVLAGVGIASAFEGLSGLWVVAIAGLVGLAGLAMVVTVFFNTWRPVRGIIGAAGRVADGEYSVRVDESITPPLRPVMRSFNDMVDRLEHSEDQRRRLLADIGHELRTPLTVVRGELEAMLDGVHPPDVEHLRPLLDDVGVMERLLEDLRTLSLAEAGTLALYPEPTDISQLVVDVADALRREAAAVDAEITTVGTDRAHELDVDPVRIREVVSNLVVNGLRALPDGGGVTIEVSATPEQVVVVVRDDGVGIEPDGLDKVFDRFHKGSGSKGTGLGLTISRDLVVAHGGTISIDSTVGVGTAVRFTLPR